MSVKFFGQYLLEKGIITPEQLLEAVKYQEASNLKFGDYAVSKGYITKDDALRVHAEQQKEDKRFGEIAMQLGILSAEQVEEILLRQKNDHVYIGAALVKKSFVDTDSLLKELALFKEDQAKYASGEIAIPEGVRSPEVVREMVGLTQKMLGRIARITAKVGAGFMSSEEPERDFTVIAVDIEGNRAFEYILSSSLEASENIASCILGINVINEPGEVIADSVKEFANIVCGNLIAKLAQSGKRLEISPPTEVEYSRERGYDLIRGRNALYYPIISTAGDMKLIIVEK